MFDTGSKTHPAGGQLEQIAGEIGGEAAVFVLICVVRSEQDVVQHFLGHATGRRQGVERYAAGNDGAAAVQARQGAIDDAGCTERVAQVEQIDIAILGFGLVGLVVRKAHIPTELPVGELEVAFQPGVHVRGLDVLLVGACEFGQAVRPAHIAPVAAVGGVVRVVVAVAAQQDAGVDGSQRKAGQLLRRLAAVIQSIELEAHVVGECVIALHVQRVALLWRDQVIVLGVVVAIFGCVEGGVLVQGVARIPAVAARGSAVGQHRPGAAGAICTEAAACRVAAIGRRARAVHWLGRDLPVARHHRIFLDAGQADDQIAALAGGAHGGVEGGALTVALAVLANVGVDFGPIEIGAGNDVDHARDGIGAIDRRGAILEDFHALHDGRGNGVQVHRAGQARDPPPAIDQHQGA